MSNFMNATAMNRIKQFLYIINHLKYYNITVKTSIDDENTYTLRVTNIIIAALSIMIAIILVIQLALHCAKYIHS